MRALQKLPGLVLTALVGIAAFAATSPVAFDKSEIDTKIASIANYKSGMGREPLIAVEQLIRQSQSRPEQRKYIELKLAGLLESDIPLESKQFICRQLWYIGTADSVPAVAKLLLREETADMACYAIGQNTSPQAGSALREAMENVSPNVRIRIINLLGDRRDRKSIEAMRRLAFGDNVQVAEAAIAALGKIGGSEARTILAEARAKGDDDLRFAATDAYLRCAEDLVAEGKGSEALKIYRELTGQNEPAFVRSAAVKGLADVGGSEAVPVVVAALSDSDRMVRTTARGCVRTMQGPGVTERFAAELPKVSPPDRVLLLGSLADRGDTAALAAIMAAGGDPDAEVREAALKAVGKLGDASVAAFLIRAAEERVTPAEKLAALNSLEVLRGNGVDDAIAKGMQESGPPVRAALIEVLYNRNAVRAVPQLMIEAAGSDSKVRKAAFKALARLAGPADLPSLVLLLVDMEDDSNRRDAERAVIAVSRKASEHDKQTEVVLAALKGEIRISARCSLLRVLGGIAGDKALNAVTQALKDSEPKVRDMAVRELAAWPNAAAAQALLEIIRDTENQTHRLLSLRGLVRSLSLPADEPSVEDRVRIYRDVVAKARGPQDKKLLLSGLANVAHPDTLKIAIACLDDEPVRTEAALATLKIAASICGARPEKAKAAAQKVLSVTASEPLKKQAENLLKIIAGFGDFITGWQVSGPYAEPGRDSRQLFDVVFGPEPNGAGKSRWELIAAGTDNDRPWLLDLSKLSNAEQQVAYLRTWVDSEQQRQARLEVASDDGLKVWLNGELIHANNVTRTLTPGSDKVDVSLQRGWNSILVKITQNDRAWEFCARLTAPDGGGLQRVRVDCLHKNN
jgi:HEAT repeat protein